MFFAMVGNDVVPFFGGGASNESDDRFGVTHVKHFVGDAWLDVDKIARFVFQDLPATIAEFVADFSFDNIKDEFEADMDVRISDAARRNGGDIRRKFGRSDVLR